MNRQKEKNDDRYLPNLLSKKCSFGLQRQRCDFPIRQDAPDKGTTLNSVRVADRVWKGFHTAHDEGGRAKTARDDRPRRRIHFVRYGMWLFVLTTALSFLLTQFHLERSALTRPEGVYRISGVVADPATPVLKSRMQSHRMPSSQEGHLSSNGIKPTSGGAQSDFYSRGKFQKIRLEDGALVMIYMKSPARRGDVVHGYAELRLASSLRNPGATSQRLWLWSCGASHSGIMRSESIRRLDRWYHKVTRIPDKIRSFVYRQCGYLFEGLEGATTVSLTLGDTQLLSDEDKYLFRASGIAHLTSVSGSHLYFFLFPIRYFMRRVARSRKLERVIILGMLWIPCLLAGWGTGIARATIMQALLWVDPVVRRRRDHANTLGFVGSFLLVLDPFSVWSRGFWMSLTISGVILMTRSVSGLESSLEPSYYDPNCGWHGRGFDRAHLDHRFSGGKSLPQRNWNKGAKSIIESFKMAFVAALSALPYQAMSSPGLFLGAPFVNVIAMVLAAWVTITGYASILLLCLCAPFPLLSTALSICCKWMTVPSARCLYLIASFGARAHALNLPARSMLWIAAFVLLVIALLRLPRRRTLLKQSPRIDRRSRVIIVLLLIGSLSLFVCYGVVRCKQYVWRVLFVDVGQGDATLLVSPRGRGFLIDGGDEGSGFHTLIPAMRYLGVSVIDVALVTHGHQDHATGVMELLRVDMVRHLVIGEGCHPFTNVTDRSNYGKDHSAEADLSGDLLELAKEHGVLVTTVCEGDRLQFDDALCHVVSASSTSSDLNDASLVLKVQIDGIDLLFTGDITQTKERILMDRGADLQCHLLHVPHHGSGKSSTSAFLNATEATTAVISAGERNRFGHPHQDTLTRLDEAGLSVYRTDLQGAIFLIIKERTGTITTWLGD